MTDSKDEKLVCPVERIFNDPRELKAQHSVRLISPKLLGSTPRIRYEWCGHESCP